MPGFRGILEAIGVWLSKTFVDIELVPDCLAMMSGGLAATPTGSGVAHDLELTDNLVILE